MIYAMFAMVLLTMAVAVLTVKARIASVKTGEVPARYYLLMRGDEAPEWVVRTGRNFNNQFELPLLFYVACALFLLLQIDSSVAVIAAWFFAVCRYLHAYIHLTSNHLRQRMYSFGASMLAVMVLWVDLVVRYS